MKRTYFEGKMINIEQHNNNKANNNNDKMATIDNNIQTHECSKLLNFRAIK